MNETTPRLRLYNTLTRSKEDFVPIDPENVRMYVCGPTVYDYAHIGNARPVIVFDVLYRLLRHLYGAEHVTYVRNITDVDDKINARAARDFPQLPLNEAIRKVTDATNAQFQADVKALGCLEPTSQPRATEHIGEMVAMIERLVAEGVAYVAQDHVLFSPSAMNARRGPRYGALSRRPLDEMLAGARVDVASYKRDEMDFVLWKPSKPGEPGWPSPAGIAVPGRPGWHIECSAMSMAKLLEPFGGGLKCDDPMKNTFDIHGGGIDLVFPHHENEIAQSCCALGTDKMANVWMHNGFLQVEGRKMAKSEGNFITINDLLNTQKFGGRSWPGEVLRLAMLKTHYRQPIDWTLISLEEAYIELTDWANALESTGAGLHLIHRQKTEAKSQPSEMVVGALAEDLNTPSAISTLRLLYRDVRGGDHQAAVSLMESLSFLGLLRPDQLAKFNRHYGFSGPRMISSQLRPLLDELQVAMLNGNERRTDELVSQLKTSGVTISSLPNGTILYEVNDGFDIESSIQRRLAFIRDKNWAEADRIRDELLEQGIQLKDGKDPATGERTTTWEVKR